MLGKERACRPFLPDLAVKGNLTVFIAESV
jgi:hypothetical protein